MEEAYGIDSSAGAGGGRSNRHPIAATTDDGQCAEDELGGRDTGGVGQCLDPVAPRSGWGRTARFVPPVVDGVEIEGHGFLPGAHVGPAGEVRWQEPTGPMSAAKGSPATEPGSNCCHEIPATEPPGGGAKAAACVAGERL